LDRAKKERPDHPDYHQRVGKKDLEGFSSKNKKMKEEDDRGTRSDPRGFTSIL